MEFYVKNNIEPPPDTESSMEGDWDIMKEADHYLADAQDKNEIADATTTRKDVLEGHASAKPCPSRTVILDYPIDQCQTATINQPVTRRELETKMEIFKAKEKLERRKEFRRAKKKIKCWSSRKIKMNLAEVRKIRKALRQKANDTSEYSSEEEESVTVMEEGKRVVETVQSKDMNIQVESVTEAKATVSSSDKEESKEAASQAAPDPQPMTTIDAAVEGSLKDGTQDRLGMEAACSPSKVE